MAGNRAESGSPASRENPSESPYSILGIPHTATPKEIQKAFRALALKHHPDKSGDPEIFKKIFTAYEALKNPSTEVKMETEAHRPEASSPGAIKPKSTGRIRPQAPTYENQQSVKKWFHQWMKDVEKISEEKFTQGESAPDIINHFSAILQEKTAALSPP